ncbi:Gfo/Idh/MocA family protein [Amycolatopsis pithecellobii]|uniref:Gfo/Idh/MocA family protein n=1 Tax=Amycolatopsis pithecellobii TaxID=664692 RepID=UPI0012B6E48F|nr:Gfo/Idh/MocA family oxidoreductase [Amycolatopsis pithecellobii]
MNTERTRIGIVGAGDIARKVNLPHLRAIPGVQLVAVCNARPESARQVAGEFGIPHVVDHWTSMVDRDDVDAIWIGTPPVMHAPIAIAALQQGKHVFCQARMAMDLAEARSMLAAARQHPELVTMLSAPPMGMKAGKLMRQLLNDGYVGEPYHFRLVADSDMFADPDAPAHWRQRRELVGMNVLTVGIYGEILQRWFGSPVRLHARSKVYVPDRDGYAVQVPDVVQVTGEWGDGVLGVLEWSGVSLFAPDSTLTLYGRDGTLEYNFTRDQVRGARRGDDEFRTFELPADLETPWTVEHDFVTAVRAGGRPEPSFETGVAYMEFTEAVHRSALTGIEILLPLP